MPSAPNLSVFEIGSGLNCGPICASYKEMICVGTTAVHQHAQLLLVEMGSWNFLPVILPRIIGLSYHTWS
jgi:ABC-type enterochelin transport system permease subunit